MPTTVCLARPAEVWAIGAVEAAMEHVAAGEDRLLVVQRAEANAAELALARAKGLRPAIRREAPHRAHVGVVPSLQANAGVRRAASAGRAGGVGDSVVTRDGHMRHILRKCPLFGAPFGTAALVLLVALGCRIEAEDDEAALSDTISFSAKMEAASRAIAMPGDRVPPALGQPRDSAHAVEIASHVLSAPRAEESFKVYLFVPVDGGFLLQLIPSPATPGGGGLVWVEVDGSVLVLRRYR